MQTYKVGFWNYVETGARDESDVAMWKDLGFNLAMSYEFDPAVHDKSAMVRMLDACLQAGLQVIVCDTRTDFRTGLRLDEDAFAAGIRAAVADFGQHPAVYGFSVGDEPGDAAMMRKVALAASTLRAAAPHLKPYLNLLPISEDTDVKPFMATHYEGMQGAGFDIVSYDYYGQCCYFEPEKYRDLYFRNIAEYRRMAKALDAETWTCLLSVGHGSLRVPTQDDLRWQLNTAAAHGLTGFMWFFLYERNFDAWWGFRNSPIDRFYRKTDLYDKLAYENKTFLEVYAPVLSKYTYVRTMHFNTCYGGYPAFTPGDGIKSLRCWINERCPLIVSIFENDTGRAIVIVNNSQTEPVRIQLDFEDWCGREQASPWFMPGGMQIFEIAKHK